MDSEHKRRTCTLNMDAEHGRRTCNENMNSKHDAEHELRT